MASPSAFFLFFPNFNFPGCYRGNRVKKGFCQEPPCILWLWFLVHMYQMMISPVLFQWDVISLRFLVHMYNMIFLSVFLYFLISLFFSFINECLKRNSEVCPTFIYVWFFSFKVSNQRLSPSSWFIPLEMVVVITGTDTQ